MYVYYTARDKSSNRLSCAVAVASSPEGPYKDLGPLVAQEPGSIDAFAVRDETGSCICCGKKTETVWGVRQPSGLRK